MQETSALPEITTDNRPFYEIWKESEGLDAIKSMFIEDLRKVPLKPWKRKGGLGVFINLDGVMGGENDAYVCEIPPGVSLLPQKHMFEETIFILEGRGATTIWNDGGPKQSFEWQSGSLFSPPLNTWHQHFNAQGDRPVRYVAVTLAPLIFNVFHNVDFVFNNSFRFADRYTGGGDYFSDKGRLFQSANMKVKVWETNFIGDLLMHDLVEWKERGAGARTLFFQMAENSIAAHVSEFPIGTYKKAHRHGLGAHIIIISGEGYSLMWEEGKPIQRYDWQVGSMFGPKEMWFHQHFNVGKEPAKYLALHGRQSQKHRSGLRDWKRDKSVKEGGDQIEYEDEDPMIREMFEAELAKRGVQCQMVKISR